MLDELLAPWRAVWAPWLRAFEAGSARLGLAPLAGLAGALADDLELGEPPTVRLAQALARAAQRPIAAETIHEGPFSRLVLIAPGNARRGGRTLLVAPCSGYAAAVLAELALVLLERGEPRALWARGAYGGAPVSLLPFATEISLLTTGSFDHPADLLAGGPPRSIAYLAVGPGIAADGWSAEAALSQGDVSSWIVAASYSGRPSRVHAIDLGVSYGAQQYRGGNPSALAVRSDGRREVGAVYGYHDWSVTRRVQIGRASCRERV